MAQTWTEEFLDYSGAKLNMMKAGEGPPLLVLHGAGGSGSIMPYHDALAEHFTVYVPSHPGFDKSTRPTWMDSIVAVSHFYVGLMDEIGLERFSVLGFSMGAWMAAEMAAMCTGRLDRLVLVSAVGIKPQHGEIAEIFTVSRERVGELRFYDTAQVPDYDRLFGRDMTPAGGRDGKAEPRDGNALVLEALHAQSQPAPLSQESFYPHPGGLGEAGRYSARGMRRTV